MNMNTFQALSRRTQPAGDDDGITNYAMGLVGEAGEVSELVKKYRFHGHDLDRGKMVEELGDVMHYLAGLCTMMGVDMGYVAENNINKLKKRYKVGFTEKESVERVDVSNG